VRWTALLLLAAVCRADSWLAFGDREWKSPDGHHALKVHEDRRFELLVDGKPAATGTLPQLPYDVHVLDGEPGAVLFECYGQIGGGDTLALLGADGKLRFRLPLEKAIPGGSGGAKRSVSSIWWSRTWWVDEPRGKAVLVAKNGTLSEVDLKTGRAAKPAKEVILDAFALPWARDKALEVAVELRPEGLREAAGKLLGDESPGTRLRAAVAVERAGGAKVTREVLDAADPDAIGFAVKYVADLGLVERAALKNRKAVDVLAERNAVASLAGLLTHGSVDPRVRAYVAQVLGEEAADEVIEAIDKEMEDAGAEAGGALLTAAIATGVPGLERRLQHHEAVLLKILDKETADVGWLADYFRGRPTSEAVQPLLRSLARHQRDPALRRRIIGALKPCTGEDHGDDARAWINALGRR